MKIASPDARRPRCPGSRFRFMVKLPLSVKKSDVSSRIVQFGDCLTTSGIVVVVIVHPGVVEMGKGWIGSMIP